MTAIDPGKNLEKGVVSEFDAPRGESVLSRKLPLKELQALASEPLQRARALPPWTYTDPRFLALEQKHVFSSSWLCVGRADALPNPGDYLTTDIAGEPLIVVRAGSGKVGAMSNVCRHRMSTLLEGRGNVRRIACPYHAWTYDLDGRLRGAPAMERNEVFRKRSIRLPRVRCDEWLGWLFVSLNTDAPPPELVFAEVTALIEGYCMQNYVESFREELQWNANWKLVAENFMESYHLPICHSGTVGGSVRLLDLKDTVLGDNFNYHYFVRSDASKLTTAHATNTRLTGDLRRTTWVLALYPSLMITLSPGYFWYLCLSPDGSSRVNVAFGGGMAPEFAADERADSFFAETRKRASAIVEEDRLCVERVYRGMQSSLATPGPLSHHEGGNYGFARWIAGRLLQ